jgi:UPF0716 protein FxsA
MSFRRRLIVFGYPLLEILTALGIGSLIGWGWMLLALVAGIPIGFAIMRHAAFQAKGNLVQGQPPQGAQAATFVGGLLIAIPGFISDLIGLALVIPITRKLMVAAFGPALIAKLTVFRVPGSGYAYPHPYPHPNPDVIIGEVVVLDPEEDSPRNQGSPPQLP